MGSLFIEKSPLFKGVLKECDGYLSELPEKPSWSIIEELLRAQDQSNIQRAEFSQPLCTALQLAVTALLASWGFRPDAVVGHSSGEIAAAYAAGFLSRRDAIVTAYYRGLVLSSKTYASLGEQPKGSMCAIGLGEQQTKSLLADYGDQVQLAAVNSPISCTVSGDTNIILEVESRCAKASQFCRRLRTDRGDFLPSVNLSALLRSESF